MLVALARLVYFGIIMSMAKQAQNDTKKRMGRPATGQGVPVMVRLAPDLLSWLDAERAKLEPEPSRPEMVRQFLQAQMNSDPN